MGRNLSLTLSVTSVAGFLLIWHLAGIYLDDPLFLLPPLAVVTGWRNSGPKARC